MTRPNHSTQRGDLRYHWNIVGHARPLAELEQDLIGENVSHAYLFAGSEKIGKFTVVRRLAQILQCEADGCGLCPTCQQIEKGYHFDTLQILDDGESIKIEAVRELLSQLYLSAQGKFRILLIKNIERMTVESANALLKTLEDPPRGVKFLLTTSRLKELPATVLSRVRLYKMNGLSEETLRDFAVRQYPSASSEDLDAVLALAAGKPGKVVSLLQDAELLNRTKTMYHQLSRLLREGGRAEAFEYVGDFAKDPVFVKDFLDMFLAVIRTDLLHNTQSLQEDSKTARRLELINRIQQTQEMLKRNVNARLALENILLALEP